MSFTGECAGIANDFKSSLFMFNFPELISSDLLMLSQCLILITTKFARYSRYIAYHRRV